ncbi:MAG: hypothetical protein AAF581_01915 [Planctomycetota bacterium]
MPRRESRFTKLAATLGLVLASLCVTTSTHAGVVVNVVEAGGDVVISASGSVDLSAWTTEQLNLNTFNNSGIVGGGGPAGTAFQLGAIAPIDFYNMPVNFTGPTSMGPGTTNFLATSFSGDKFGLTSSITLDRIIVPAFYVSGSAISNTTTWAGATFDSLGIEPGSYTWTWGSGPTADFVTVNVGTAVLRIGTTTAVQGSATLVAVPITLEVTAGTFNGVEATLTSSMTLDSIAVEPSVAGVTADVAVSSTVSSPNITITLDSGVTPTPISAPFGPVLIATAFYDASALASGEIGGVDFVPATTVIDDGTTTYTPALLRGGVIADGNNASQIYFAEETADVVNRLLLDGTGAPVSTTPVVPGPDRPVALAVDANNILWAPEFQVSTLKRYNGTALIDTITVGSSPGAIAIDVEGSAWVGLRFLETITKVSAAGQVLYGPGGALGAGFPVNGRPIRIAADPNGPVWVLTLSATVPGDGALHKFGPDGEELLEIPYDNVEVVRGLALDHLGFVWLAMSGKVVILNSDGTIDAEIPVPGGGLEKLVTRRTNLAQAGQAPGDSEAWILQSFMTGSQLRRVRRNGVLEVPLTGLTCTFGGPNGIHVDGLGQVWATGGGCAIRVDATTAGTPTIVEEISGFSVPLGNTGDSAGYFQANVLHPSTGVYSDIDADTVSNGAELLAGTNPFVANAVVVPPVTGLTCTPMGVNADVEISWVNGALYTTVVISVNGVETVQPGTQTNLTIVAAANGVYDIGVQGFDMASGLLSEAATCQVVVGPGAVTTQAPVGLSIFDITATGLSAPDPAYYVTDVGTDTILALDASFNVLADLGNPFIDSVPRGIAYDPPGIPFQGPVTGSLILTGHKVNDSIKAVRTDLSGTSTSLEFDLLDDQGNQFNTSAPPKGLAHDDATNILAMSGPVNCEMFSYNTGGAFFVGPNSLTADIKWTHPNPGSSLNGIELESFGLTGGTAWISQTTASGDFEIQRITVSAAGAVTVEPETLTLGAVPEISVGGFSFTPDPLVDNTVAVVGISTSSVYEVNGIADVIPVQFNRGDCNNDGMFDIGDQVFMLSMLFSMGTPAACRDACDDNDDGGVDVGDAVYGLIALFSMGPPPPPPFGSCGTDPTPDNTPCDSFASCP